jgi:hypothetical protein
MTVDSWLENPMERDHAEDMVVNGRVILKCFKEIVPNRVDYILLAVDRDRWPGLLNVLPDIRFP